MGSHRIAQVDALIRQELDRVIRRVVDLPEGCIVTIESVATTRDLHQTRVSVSVFPFHQRFEAIRILKEMQPDICKELAKRLVLRTLPKLIFLIDEREERVDRINRILDGDPGME